MSDLCPYACPRLMIDASPIFLLSATDAGVIAPAQATVVSTFAKFWTPGMDSFVTFDCAAAIDTLIATMTNTESSVLIFDSMAPRFGSKVLAEDTTHRVSMLSF